MNEYLRRALRRNVRLASRLAAPVMLTLGLTMFGLSQIGPASTLWSETLTIGGSATTGAFACKPLQVTGGTVTTSGSGPSATTTYTYTLNGGGDKNGSPECANKDLSYFALPVCFKPDDTVTAHTQPANWTYAPKNTTGQYQVKWDAGNQVGAGPFTNVTFSFTVAGTSIPTEQVQALIHAGDGQATIDAGIVTVPRPESCTQGARLAGSGSASVLDAPAETTDSTESPTPVPTTTTTTGAGPAPSEPTKAPSPTPTATPAPRTTPTPRTNPGGAFEYPTTVVK